MKIHSTNYTNTFITVAQDCPAIIGEIPPDNADTKTAAHIQFEMAFNYPYKFSSDEILFQIFASKNELTINEYQAAREKFFSKGQPCLRASPLTKRYGWGVHYDWAGKIALYGVESIEYKQLAIHQSLNVLKAMNSSK